MENINNYLLLIISLMTFYCIIMLYLKYGYKHNLSSFTPISSGIPDVSDIPIIDKLKPVPDIYLSEDTRMQFPLLPPVNPIARQRIIETSIPANLYTNQTYDTEYSILDEPQTNNTNQLIYSGGDTKMIKIPLQYNYPYNEQLRSQDILITPYNKIKYNC